MHPDPGPDPRDNARPAWRRWLPYALLSAIAAFALATAPKSTCRAWARQIRATWPDLDGLWAPSTMTGDANVVLWSPGGSSLPASPSFSRPLAEPTVRAIAGRIARQELGYRLI